MSTPTRVASAALALLLTLTALALVRPGVAGADGHGLPPSGTDEDGAARTPAETPAVGGADGRTQADDDAGQHLVADTPVSDGAGDADARTGPGRLLDTRDPRWIDFRNCDQGLWACAIAKQHQDDGFYMWRDGKVFITHDGRRVQGHPGHTWSAYHREADALVRYLQALDFARLVQQHRDDLVRRWSGVAHCESGGNWSIANGNGYYGGLQFSLSTWRAYGGQGYPHQQPAWHQAEVAERLRQASGLHHWPHCGRYYG